MNKRALTLFLGDFCLAVFAACSGEFLGLGPALANGRAALDWEQAALFIAATVTASYLSEFYSTEKRADKKTVFIKTLITLVVSLSVLGGLYLVARPLVAPWRVCAVSVALFVVLQFFWHLSFGALLQISMFEKKILVVGTGKLANKIGDIIKNGPKGQVLKGYYKCSDEPVHVPPEAIVKNGDGLQAVVRREKAHKIVISVTDRRGTLPVDDILQCKFGGIEVVDAPSFYEEKTGKLLIENLRPSWFIFSDGFRLTPAFKFFKRVFDVLFAASGLILSALLMPAIALAIKFDSRGPVFFRQVRAGEKEEPFTIYKFRTMRTDAEKNGAVWASEKDPRVTRSGRFLRKSRLDEIPQLFNVLKGDMSFVGPRPERPEFVNELKRAIPYYSERHFVRPGLTGWAQVRFPYGASIEDAIEKLRYDLYYIKNMSLFLDVYIVLETVKVILLKRGSR